MKTLDLIKKLNSRIEAGTLNQRRTEELIDTLYRYMPSANCDIYHVVYVLDEAIQKQVSRVKLAQERASKINCLNVEDAIYLMKQINALAILHNDISNIDKNRIVLNLKISDVYIPLHNCHNALFEAIHFVKESVASDLISVMGKAHTANEAKLVKQVDDFLTLYHNQSDCVENQDIQCLEILVEHFCNEHKVNLSTLDRRRTPLYLQHHKRNLINEITLPTRKMPSYKEFKKRCKRALQVDHEK